MGYGAVVVGVAVVGVDDHASWVRAAHGGDLLSAVPHLQNGERRRSEVGWDEGG